MMPSPEYERFSALKGDDLEAEYRAAGLNDYSGDTKSYQSRLARIRELAMDGKGVGAWFERFMHECQQARAR